MYYSYRPVRTWLKRIVRLLLNGRAHSSGDDRTIPVGCSAKQAACLRYITGRHRIAAERVGPAAAEREPSSHVYMRSPEPV